MNEPVSLQRSIRWTMSSVALFVVSLPVGVSTWLDVRETQAEVASMRQGNLERHKERVRAQVDNAVFYLEHTLPAGGAGEIDRKVKDEVLDFLQEIRFGNEDVLFGIDFTDPQDSTSLLGAFPRYVKYSDIPAPRVLERAREMYAIAQTGGGFLAYKFSDRLGKTPDLKKRLKVTYVSPLTSANWLIGAGVDLPSSAVEARQLQVQLWERLLWRLTCAICCLVLAIVVIRLVFNRVAKSFNSAFEQLSKYFERASQHNADVEQADVGLTELVPVAQAAHRMMQRRRMVEAQLHHSQKLDAVGQLAGGIAHDFNNLLTAILGSGQNLIEQLEPSDERFEDASIICEAAERAALLTRQMLAFSRKARVQSTQLDLHDIIRHTTHIFGQGVDPRISIVLELGAKSSLVVGDGPQLENALFSLCANARDALTTSLQETGAGQVCIATAEVVLTEEKEEDAEVLLQPGKYVEMRITDDGCGMSDSVRGRIFEPFYTTKAPGVGTGLGLSGTYGCIREHGGGISVESKEGAGTAFRILLPMCELDSDDAQSSNNGIAPQGTGLILVVDDQTAVRNLTTKQLEGLGYSVLACENGEVGLEQFERHHSSLVLVVLDLMMPVLSGEEMFRAIAAINSAVPVLLCSGYGKNDVGRRLLSEGAVGLLAKPFREDELARAVASAERSVSN